MCGMHEHVYIFFFAIKSYCFDYDVNAFALIVSCEGDIGDRVAVMDRFCYSNKQNTLCHTDSIQTGFLIPCLTQL